MLTIPSLKLTVNFIKDRKQVIAYSPTLDISTVGDSEAHAKKRFQELARIFIKDISDRDVVDDVLTELGWKKVFVSKSKHEWIPPRVKSVDLQVPMMA